MNVEPEGVIVAKEGDNILGFIIVTKDESYLIRNAFLKGYVLRWAISMALGRFGLNINMMKKFIRFFISFLFMPMMIIQHSSKLKAKIVAIIVAEEKRNLGIGKTLVDRVLQYLRENNIKSVRVTAQINNLLALDFYKSCGFSISGSCIESTGRNFILTKTLNF